MKLCKVITSVNPLCRSRYRILPAPQQPPFCCPPPNMPQSDHSPNVHFRRIVQPGSECSLNGIIFDVVFCLWLPSLLLSFICLVFHFCAAALSDSTAFLLFSVGGYLSCFQFDLQLMLLGALLVHKRIHVGGVYT